MKGWKMFVDIDSFNEDCIKWLMRTGNAKVHDITKKVPAEVFELERQHLLPVPLWILLIWMQMKCTPKHSPC